MRSFLFSIALLCLLASARLHRSLIPEDPHAFPKYHVAFLNNLPLSNDSAQRWLHHGLQGGELEFLDKPWQPLHTDLKQIDASNAAELASLLSSSPSSHDQQQPMHRLEHMKIGPHHSYLCLIPPEPQLAHDASFSSQDEETTVLQSWSLLQPLSGKCLYHRQGWFTYSYCHNIHVRQFREEAHVHPHVPGYQPEEDPEWDAFTLGQAPNNPDAGADLTVAQQNALAVNLELAQGAGNRYLVQRWGEGTLCEKTGRPREIEVQFHCSMTVTDTILFIKETTTCNYVLVIQTPRLCRDPAFRSRLESRDEATIKCREIISSSGQLDYHSDDETAREETLVPLHIKTSDGESAPSSSTPPAQKESTMRKAAVSSILTHLKEHGLESALEGLSIEDFGVEVDVLDDAGEVTERRQYQLTEEDVANALWSTMWPNSGDSNGKDEDEEGDGEDAIEHNGRAVDEL